MCGRFTITVTLDELKHYLQKSFDIDLSDTFFDLPRYNVAPGQDVIALIHDGQKFRVGLLKWGFHQFQQKPMINARSETAFRLPSFKESFMSKRCLVLADGFYEWMSKESKKQPMRIIKKDRGLFPIAGLYQSIQIESGKKEHQVILLTTQANERLESIHSRMPVIIDEQNAIDWLYPKQENVQKLIHLMKPYHSDLIDVYPASQKVNDATYDQPDCIRKQ